MDMEYNSPSPKVIMFISRQDNKTSFQVDTKENRVNPVAIVGNVSSAVLLLYLQVFISSFPLNLSRVSHLTTTFASYFPRKAVDAFYKKKEKKEDRKKDEKK